MALGLIGCARKEPAPAPAPAASSKASDATPTPEVPVTSLPLELGEGDDRTRTFQVWPADGSNAIDLPAGTRIERVREMSWHTRPATVPEKSRWRIRVLSGEKQGLVAYVHGYETQAAR